MVVAASNRETMAAYVDALITHPGDFARSFADDVVLDTMWGGPHAEGREAVERTIRLQRFQAFDATPEVKRLTVGEDSATLEAVFAGKHIAEFNGVAATGKQVSVPFVVQYDLAGGRIKALRVYLPMAELMRQIQG